MAGSDDDSAKASFRQNQQGKKRREAPIIDAKATDVSEGEIERDPAIAAQQPEMSKPEAAPTPDTEEPVLFGQVLRGSVPPSPKPDADLQGADRATADAGVDPAATGETSFATSTTGASEVEASQATISGREATANGSPSRAASEPNFGPFGTGPFDDTVSNPSGTPPAAARSRATTILGALAVLLLLVIAGLLFAGPRRGGTDEIKAALDAANGRIAALEARPDPTAMASQIAQLDQRAGAAEAEIAALKTGAEATSGRLGTLASRVEEPTPTVAAVAPASPLAGDAQSQPSTEAAPSAAPAQSPTPAATAPSETATDLAALAGRVDDLSTLPGKVSNLAARIETLPVPPAPVDIAPLQGSLSDLTQQVDALRTTVGALPKVDIAPVETQVGDLRDRIGRVDRGLTTLSAAVAALPKLDIDPLKAAVAATDQRLAPIEAALAVPKAGEHATEARAIGSAEESRAAPLAVVAQEASRGIADGRPIVREVDALRALGVDEAALAPLNAIAAKGAPSIAALKASWAESEPQILAAMKPAQSEGLLARLKAGARGIVSVRRVGAPTGEDAGSVAGRLSAALSDGDVEAALGEWDKLPDAARTMSQTWADSARSRLDAQAAATALASSAIDTLAKAKG